MVSAGSWLSVTPTSGTTPATLTITVDPTSLSAGSYTGSYTVQTTVSSGGQIVTGTDTSNVTLNVTAPPASTTAVVPTSLSFTGSVGQPIAPQSLTLSSTPSSLGFTATPSAAWFTATPSSGTTGGSPGSAISVAPITAGLSAGTFNGTLAISLPGGTPSSISVPIQLVLTNPPAVNVTVPAALSFSYTIGGTLPSAQLFNLVAGTSNLTFTSSITNASWLGLSTPTGSTPATETVTVNPAGLSGGTYNGSISFQVANGNPASFSVPVTLTVTAAPPALTTVTPLPTGLTINAQAGGAAPAPSGINLQTPAGTTGMAFTASTDTSWLAVTPASGTTSASLQVTASTSGMSAGTVTGHVNISIPGAANPSVSVTVTLNLTAAPTLNISPSGITLQATAGSPPSSAPANLYLTTTSTQPVAYSVAASGGSWLVLGGGSLSGSVSATSPVTILVSGDPTQGSLAAGPYTGSITVTQGSLTTNVPVSFTVVAAPPALKLDKQQVTLTGNAGGALLSQNTYLTTNPGTLAFTAASSASWLTVSPASRNRLPEPLARCRSLQAGCRLVSGTVTVTAGSSTVSLTVNLNTVAPNAPSFTLNPTSVTLSQTASVSPQPAASALVALSGLSGSASSYSLLNWNVSVSTASGGTWLSASPLSTTQLPFTFQVFADGTNLTVGQVYSGTVTVTAKGSTTVTASLPVTFSVSATPNSYTVSPSILSEQAVAGGAAFTDSFILNPAAPGLQYTIQSNAPWLTVSSTSGTMPAQITVNINPGTLTTGPYFGTLTITATGPANQIVTGATQYQNVNLSIAAPAPPVPIVTQGPAQFSLQQGQIGQMSNLSTTLAFVSASGGSTSLCGGGCPGTQLTVSTTTSWLQLSTTAFLLSAGSPVFEIDGSLNASALPATPGNYSGQFTISGASGPIFTGSVSLQITAQSYSFSILPSSASANVVAGSALSQTTENVSISGSTSSFNVSLSSDSSWLIVPSPSTVSNNSSVNLTIDPTKLSVGTYLGTVTIHPTAATGTAYDQYFTVSVNATTAASLGVSVTVAPVVQTGSAGKAASYALSIVNPGSQSPELPGQHTELAGLPFLQHRPLMFRAARFQLLLRRFSTSAPQRHPLPARLWPMPRSTSPESP